MMRRVPEVGTLSVGMRHNPSFPIKSTCKCNLLKIRYGFFQGNQLIGINIPIIKLLNFVFCKYSKICELWVQIIGKLRVIRDVYLYENECVPGPEAGDALAEIKTSERSG